MILVASGMVTGAEKAKAIAIPTSTANLDSFAGKTIARTQKISQVWPFLRSNISTECQMDTTITLISSDVLYKLLINFPR